jgi:integrase
MESRPKPKKPADGKLVFLTKYGAPWAKETPDNPVTKEFRKLLDSIDSDAAGAAKVEKRKAPPKLYRKGLGFYALRHTFETIAGETRDQVATNAIMGHVDVSMAGVYRERIGDDRLRAVTDHVRAWLFGADESK